MDELSRGRPFSDVVRSREFDEERMEAVRLFLTTAQYLDSATGRATPKLKDLFEARGWYEMMIGGYAETFLNIAEGFPRGSRPVSRNGEMVGRGSCEMSKHDSLPIVKRLIADARKSYGRLLDMGCGSGIYLTELCQEFPEMTAVGIDPSEGAVEAARQHVAQDPTAARITIESSDAVDWMERNRRGYDLGIICFVIHEILGQRGDAAVDGFLNAYFDNSPDADLIVIDIDHKWLDTETMHKPLSRNYYNQYFLLHPFTNQRLETADYWDEKYKRLGLTVVNKLTTDPSMDSTGIVVGWLLRRGG
jgi:2-ketoarginine methyltransferase